MGGSPHLFLGPSRGVPVPLAGAPWVLSWGLDAVRTAWKVQLEGLPPNMLGTRVKRPDPALQGQSPCKHPYKFPQETGDRRQQGLKMPQEVTQGPSWVPCNVPLGPLGVSLGPSGGLIVPPLGPHCVLARLLLR